MTDHQYDAIGPQEQKGMRSNTTQEQLTCGPRIRKIRRISFPPTSYKFQHDQPHKETTQQTDRKIHKFFGVDKNATVKKYNDTYTIDPVHPSLKLWNCVVFVASIYNLWMVILRIAFQELQTDWTFNVVFNSFDLLVDIIFIFDVVAEFHVGYYEDGLVVTDQEKIAQHYMNMRRSMFIRDVITAIPVSHIVSFVYGHEYFTILRLIKLMKSPVIIRYFNAWEMKTSLPHLLRTGKMLLYLFTIIHWVACLYYIISDIEGHGSNEWVIPVSENDVEYFPFWRKYMLALYWTTMTLTTVGETWGRPHTDIEYVFTGCCLLLGVFCVATVVGNVGDVISNMNAAKQEFQNKMDVIKLYMTNNQIPGNVQDRVKKWAEYSWNNTQAMDDNNMLDILPMRLQTEIAKHVHYSSLKNVPLFSGCEQDFLLELAVQLRSQIYLPGDYVCRLGEIGREMYIIAHGKLEVTLPDATCGWPTVVNTMGAGDYFGEISLLEVAKTGCGGRRSADVRSCGYSELLVLTKGDLLKTLDDYPQARNALEVHTRKRVSGIQHRKSHLQHIFAAQSINFSSSVSENSSNRDNGISDEDGDHGSQKSSSQMDFESEDICQKMTTNTKELTKEISELRNDVQLLQKLITSKYFKLHNRRTGRYRKGQTSSGRWAVDGR